METNNMNAEAGHPAAPNKIGKVKGGYLVVTESFKLLGKNKSIMMFPFFSMVVELIVVATALLVFFMVFGFSKETFDRIGSQNPSPIEYLCLFAFYILSVFIASFFQAGLVAVVSGQINGKKLSFGEGMEIASQRAWKIFYWSFIAATVGVVLQIIADRLKFLGRLAANIIGFAWDIATFFIVPVLVLENETVGSSIKRSGMIFKNKWGQTLIANFSTGLFFGFLLVLGVVAFFAAIIFGMAVPGLVISMAVGLLVYVLAIMVLSSTIEGIYRVVLYEYAAHEKLPESFNRELVVNAIKNGK